jgi:hypothetical protein
MSWLITPGWSPADADAAAYITAVEAADNQALENGVKVAIDNFVLGCKADGIWNAIKASCILAGARTLNGALVPLVGAAPTSFNFVSGDYNRKTGLVGNGSTKFLNSNRAANADPQNSIHTSIYRTDSTLTTASLWGSRNATNTRNSQCYYFNNAFYFSARTSFSGDQVRLGPSSANGFFGVNRSNGSTFNSRFLGANATASVASVVPTSETIAIFAENAGGTISSYHPGRLSFYSIGESLDLALLDARVTTLVNAFAAAIP